MGPVHNASEDRTAAVPPVVVCVTGAPSSADVIRKGAELAKALGADLFAIYVSQPSPAASSTDDTSALPHLALAEKLGAIAETIAAPRVVEAVVTYARRRGAGHVVVGSSPSPPSMAQSLLKAGPDFLVHVVPTETSKTRRRWVGPRLPGRLDPLVALVAVGGATGVALLSRPLVADADLVMIYLLAIALASVWLHRVSAIVAAMLSVVAFNFFFVDPVGSFAVAQIRYLLTFAVMTVVGVVVSTIATRMRDRARGERERSRRMSVLLDVTRGLTSASTIDHIGALGVRSLQELTRARVGIVLQAPAGEVRFGDHELVEHAPPWPEVPDTLDSDPAALVPEHLVPIAATGGPVGEAVISSGDWDRSPATRQVVRAALSLLGATVERLALDEQARTARLTVEIEQTRSDLLSAVSHDLRTPLGTIKGAATVLRDSWDHLDGSQRHGLLHDIVVEADRLARMLANLLDISRLRGRDVGLTGDWHSPDDVVGSALRAGRALLEEMDVRTRLPEQVSLVWMDPILVEQALVNLLENAARHARIGPVEVTVDASADGVTFEVADRGPGFGPGDTRRWFTRFERGGASAGTGLGLAITRAVVELHGGWIDARDRVEGGAAVRFFLPVGGPRGEPAPTWEDAEEGTHG